MSWGSAFCTVNRVPFTFVSKSLSKCSSVIFPKVRNSPKPALAKTMSIFRPLAFTVSYAGSSNPMKQPMFSNDAALPSGYRPNLTVGACGQFRSAISAALRSSFRVAPPAACMVMPYITIER